MYSPPTLLVSELFLMAGLKVGIIGVIQLGPLGIPSTHPDNLKGIWFTPAMAEISKYEWLSKQCDVTILLSHLGYPDDQEMAKMFPWLDLIIGGHTHTQLKGDEVVNGVLITQNKNKFGRVTYTTITLEDGKIVDRMIQRACEYPDGEEKDALVMLIANHMKKLIYQINNEDVDDAKIFKDLEFYSKGRIKLSTATHSLHEFKVAPTQQQTSKKKKKK